MSTPSSTVPSFTSAEKLACAERELAQRKRVYPRLISVNRMSPVKAAREIQLMEAIIGDYRELVASEDLLSRGQ